VKDIGLRCLVGPDRSYLNTVLGVCVTALDEGRSDDGHGVVPLGHDQHSDELLVAVDDEVTAEFLGFLLVLDELSGAHLLQMASVGLFDHACQSLSFVQRNFRSNAVSAHPQHDGHLAQFPHRLLPVPIVDLVLEPCAQSPSIRRMSLAAFRRVDVSVAGVELVGGRQRGLLEEELLDADVEAVALWRPPAFGQPRLSLLGGLGVAVQEGLDTNVLQAGLQHLAALEERVEGVDMRPDGFCQGGVGCVVLWRVPEQPLPPERVIVDGPVGVCGSRSHGGR